MNDRLHIPVDSGLFLKEPTIMGFFMQRAGAAAPSADRITLLRDTDGDGVAELKSAFLENLTSPFGMDLVDGRLYVADTDAIVHFPYQEGETVIDARGDALAELPAGIVTANDGSLLVTDDVGNVVWRIQASN